jgi:uncharacterized membrane protein (DUF485 family)
MASDTDDTRRGKDPADPADKATAPVATSADPGRQAGGLEADGPPPQGHPPTTQATGTDHGAVEPEGLTAAVEAAHGESKVEELSTRRNRFVWPMTVFFLVYYLSLPILAGELPDLMGTKVFGEFTFGYLFALSQFVMAFIVAWVYTRWARRRLDPVADSLREQLHAGSDREVVR